MRRCTSGSRCSQRRSLWSSRRWLQRTLWGGPPSRTSRRFQTSSETLTYRGAQRICENMWPLMIPLNWLYVCDSDQRHIPPFRLRRMLTPPYRNDLRITPIKHAHMSLRKGTHVDTILSPALAIAEMAMNCADCPLDAATAATPPSRAAMRASNTPWSTHRRAQKVCKGSVRPQRTTVGFATREYVFPTAFPVKRSAAC